MRHIARYVIMFAVTLALSGCATLFRDDYEHNPVGVPPVVPPAHAARASVVFSDTAGVPRPIVVPPGLTGARSLRFDGSRLSADPLLSDAGMPVSYIVRGSPARRFYWSWSGKIDPGAAMSVSIGRQSPFFGGFRPIVLVSILPDGIQVPELNQPTFGAVRQDGRHTISIFVDPVTGEFGVTFIGTGTQTRSGMLDAEQIEALRASTVMRFSASLSKFTDAGTGYSLDDVSWSERNTGQ